MNYAASRRRCLSAKGFALCSKRVLARPVTGLEADKAFYDELSADP
jgi:hypothetical protein